MLGSRATPVERDLELQTISAAIGCACDGEGTLLLIHGGPGIGKSRLCSEARQLAEAQGMRVLAARGGEHEQDIAYGVARQLFERLLHDADASTRRRRLAGPARLASAALGDQFDEMPVAPESGAPHGLYWLAANVADEQPLALLVDDAQWADLASQRFLLYLTRRLEGEPLLLIVAARTLQPGDQREILDQLGAEPAARRLAIGPLTASGSTQLVESRAGRTLSAELATAVHEVTGGNPFYLLEVADGLASVPIGDDAAAVAHVRSQPPEAVRRALLLRIGRLSPAARRLAESLAVVGEGAGMEAVRSVAGISQPDAVAAIEQLTAAGITAPGPALAFAHPIVRAAVRDELSEVERRELHRVAARVISERGAMTEDVAHHLLASEPAGDPWTVSTLRVAARRNIARAAPAAAIPLLARALSEPPPVAERASVMAELGEAELAVGDSAAIDHLRAAVEFDPPPERLLDAAIALANALAAAEGTPSALAVLTSVIDRLDGEEAFRAEVERTTLSLFAGGTQEEAPRLERYAKLPGETVAQRIALAMTSIVLAFDPARAVDDVLPLARRALAGGALGPEHGGGAPTLANAWYVLCLCEQLDEAEAQVAAGFESARARGSLMEFTASTMLAVVIAVQRGDLASAVASGEAALEIWPQIERTPALERWFSTSIRCFVEALLRRGDVARAREIASALASDGDTSGTMFGLVAVAGALVAQAEADDARALDALMAYGGVFRAIGIEDRMTPWRLYAALSLHRLGRRQEAVELADEAVDVAGTWGTPGGLGVAHRVRGIVGDSAEAPERLQRAVDTLRRSAYRLELAEALVDLGRAERRAGRPKSSRAPLIEGLDLAIACGAGPLAERARSELRVAGARRRRDRITGRDALTPTEQRIATLAAGGDTNREIAQALFVTPKTIEVHLTNVYRKLDISGRAQLAEALEDAAG